MPKMDFYQLEQRLDSLKGEESVFKLYREGKYGDVKDINQALLGSGLYNVRKLKQFVEFEEQGRVLGVVGEKGVGKSTVLSAAALSALIDGKVKALRYFRYDPTSQSFQKMFHEGDEYDSRSVTVVDDVHYFFPEFVENVFRKGSVRYFDAFVRQLIDINKPMLQEMEKPSGSRKSKSLVYVSDTFSFGALKSSYDKLLFAANRGDLIQLLPDLTKKGSSWSKLEIDLDGEFYGKTYAAAGGDPALYDAAFAFGNRIREETGILATNPRYLKMLIGSLKESGAQLDPLFFRDAKFMSVLLSGDHKAAEINRIYNERLEDIAQRLVSDSHRMIKDASGRIRKVLGTDYIEEIFDEGSDFFRGAHGNWSNNYRERVMGVIREANKVVRSVESTRGALLERLYAELPVPSPSDLESEPGKFWDSRRAYFAAIPIEVSKKMAEMRINLNFLKETVERNKSFFADAQREFEERLKSVGAVRRAYGYNIAGVPEQKLEQVMTKFGVHKQFYRETGEEKPRKNIYDGQIRALFYSGLMSKLESFSERVEEKAAEVSDISKSIDFTLDKFYKQRVAPVMADREEKLALLSDKKKIEGYRKLYKERIRKHADETVAKSPGMFSVSDIQHVRQVAEDPQGLIEGINKHTLSLITNLTIIP